MQQEIIRHIVAGGDAFVLMPTGSGKSLCYQIPAMLRDGVAVVVSPLIALMEDQVAALREAGVRAAMLNSSLTSAEQSSVISGVRGGAFDLLYVAPERLTAESTLTLLDTVRIALFAIDEAHCVSLWGHDFRPEYMGLSVLRTRYPDVPLVALTATADQRTQVEIVDRLLLRNAKVFAGGFDRPNIRYQIELKQNSKKQLLAFLDSEHPGESGIVYCISRSRTEKTAEWLTQHGRVALPYHAGMSAEDRRSNQRRFLREDAVIIVATIAFGMGIDKPDVRFVAHLDLPKSIESYYQETGRAGRDGLPADAWMVYGLTDAATLRGFIDQSDADEARKRVERGKLNALLGLCETTACRRQTLLQYFGDSHPGQCGNCDTCLNPVESWDGTLASRKALYLVKATGQRFGVHYLVDVLTGSDNERIEQFGHHKLSAYGKGKELTDKQWLSVFRQLMSLGYLTVDYDGHGGLSLTPDSLPVLENKVTVRFRSDDARPKTKAERSRRTTTALDVSEEDEALLNALRSKRREIALEHNVPSYVIFHDSTLQEIAVQKPATLADMRNVTGVGERKLAAYGKVFLDVVRAQ
jgi:ATP-dependent DNA helicase RecQ